MAPVGHYRTCQAQVHVWFYYTGFISIIIVVHKQQLIKIWTIEIPCGASKQSFFDMWWFLKTRHWLAQLDSGIQPIPTQFVINLSRHSNSVALNKLLTSPPEETSNWTSSSQVIHHFWRSASPSPVSETTMLSWLTHSLITRGGQRRTTPTRRTIHLLDRADIDSLKANVHRPICWHQIWQC